MRKKKLAAETKVGLAMAFVGGVNSNFLPAIATNVEHTSAQQTYSISIPVPNVRETRQQAARDKFLAYAMLERAMAYLDCDDRNQVEENYPLVSSPRHLRHATITDTLVNWVKLLTEQKKRLETHTASEKDMSSLYKSLGLPENLDEAEETLSKARSLLNRVDDQNQKLDLTFIAMLILQNVGNTYGARECNSAIENILKDYEGRQTVELHENEEIPIKSAVAVLNAKAYAIVAVDPTYNAHLVKTTRETPVKAEPKEIAKAEALWLRSIALADKLKTTSNTRRMAHRNLCIWYQRVGKPAEADQQKQILFSLIGEHDDKFLYPIYSLCGSPVWWHERPTNGDFEACGMG